MFSESYTRNFSFLSILKQPASIAVLLFFFLSFADGAMLPFFALWAQKDAAIPIPWIGALFACYAGGEIIATPLIGGIADRIGRRPVLLMSMLGVGGGFLLLSFAHGVWHAAIVLLMIGSCESVLHPTVSTVIADTVPADKARRYFAMARVASNVGRAAGPAVGALLALHALSTVFVGSAVSLLIGACVVACLLPETRPDAGTSEDDEEGFSALLPAFRDRRLAGLLFWVMLLEISGSWVETVLPLYAHDAGSISPSTVGLLFTFGATLVAIFQLPVTHLTTQRPASTLILGSGIALIAAFAALLVSPTLPAMLVAMALFAAADMLSGPMIPTLVNDMAPPNRRATYMAAISVTNDLKDTLGPASGTMLFALGRSLPWIAGLPLSGLAALALARSLRKRPQTTAIEETSLFSGADKLP